MTSLPEARRPSRTTFRSDGVQDRIGANNRETLTDAHHHVRVFDFLSARVPGRECYGFIAQDLAQLAKYFGMCTWGESRVRHPLHMIEYNAAGAFQKSSVCFMAA